jgi:hypothetical protein
MRFHRPAFALAFAAILAGTGAPLKAVGLNDEESYAGLAGVQGNVFMTWTMDDDSVKQLGGSDSFVDAMASLVFKRLSDGDVPMKDGTFNPDKDAFVSLDIWTRGVTAPQDFRDPQRVFHFQFQVFAPSRLLRTGSKQAGRMVVWERSEYGVVPAEAIQQRFRDFLKLCDDFSADWRAAHPLGQAEHQGSGQEPASGQDAASTPSQDTSTAESGPQHGGNWTISQ